MAIGKEKPGRGKKVSTPKSDVAATPAIAPFFRASLHSDGVLEILIYQEVGEYFDWGSGEMVGITALGVKRQIESAGEYSSIVLRINSPGGDVFEGIGILNVLRAQPKPITVMIDGIAASIASVIAMSGEQRLMGIGAMMMVHQASGACYGNSGDMAEMAQALGAIDKSIAAAYASRTGETAEESMATIKNVAWLTAEEAISRGFATGMQPNAAQLPGPDQESARALAQKFRNKVDSISNSEVRRKETIHSIINAEQADPETENPDEGEGECDCVCENCMAGDCVNCVNLTCNDEDCVDCPMQKGMKAKAQISGMSALMSHYRIHGHAEVTAATGEPILAIRSKGKLGFKSATVKQYRSGERAPDIITGTLAPYDSSSCDLGGFVEVYQPGCFNDSLKADDPRICASHNTDHVLGRKSAGTASFWDEPDGLHYECTLPDTQTARDLKASMARGDISESSAAFFIVQQRMELRGGIRTRIVEKARLVEGGPHAFAAYDDSTAIVEGSTVKDDTMQVDNNGLEMLRLKLRLLKSAS